MQLRWTEAAAADLERIADYLFAQAPDIASRLVRSIYDAPGAIRCKAPLQHGIHGSLGNVESVTTVCAAAISCWPSNDPRSSD